MFMPRISAAYKLGEKTVVKGGYGMFYDTLNAADYSANNLGYNSTTTVTNSTDFGQTFALGDPRNGVLGISDPFPVRNGQRFDQPFEDTLGVDAGAGSASTRRTRITSTRGCSGGASEFSANWRGTCRSSSPTTGRTPIVARSASGRTICPSSHWITGTPEQCGPGRARRERDKSVHVTNFESLRTTNPDLYQRMSSNAFFTSATAQANRLLRPFSHYQHRDASVSESAAR